MNHYGWYPLHPWTANLRPTPLPPPLLFRNSAPNLSFGQNVPQMPFQPMAPPMTWRPIVIEQSLDPSKSEEVVTKSYVCKLCHAFSTSDVRDLKEHLNIHSSKGRPFVCQFCAKEYRFRCLWRNHVVIHMALRHKALVIHSDTGDSAKTSEYKQNFETNGDEKPEPNKSDRRMKCPECDYMTDTKVKLQRHQTTHTRERPFACVECNSTFSQTGSLKGHLKKVHKIKDLKLRCKYCSFEFLNFGPFITHIEKIHKNLSFDYEIVD